MACRCLHCGLELYAPCDPAQMRAIGIAHIPEDRQQLGLVDAFSAAESAILGYQRDHTYSRCLLLVQTADERTGVPG